MGDNEENGLFEGEESSSDSEVAQMKINIGAETKISNIVNKDGNRPFEE